MRADFARITEKLASEATLDELEVIYFRQRGYRWLNYRPAGIRYLTPPRKMRYAMKDSGVEVPATRGIPRAHDWDMHLDRGPLPRPATAALALYGEMVTAGTHWVQMNSPMYKGGSWRVGWTELGASGWNGRPDRVAMGKSCVEAILRAYCLWKIQPDGLDNPDQSGGAERWVLETVEPKKKMRK